ncbi:MAG: hypothetical protein OEY49_20320, partial [Candidatus Heimdallarchaeota archaeon]|nr:hypothetical protein [Candidatus Heimdallarchaeota archaeon]
IFLDGLLYLKEDNPDILIITQQYDIIKAIESKLSNFTGNQEYAIKVFRGIISEDIIDYELTLFATISLCEMLLIHAILLEDDSKFVEGQVIFENLLKVFAEQKSYSLLAEIYFLQAKISILKNKFEMARSLLEQCLQLMISKGYFSVSIKISNLLDDLLEHFVDLGDVKASPEIIHSGYVDTLVAQTIKIRDIPILKNDYAIAIQIYENNTKEFEHIFDTNLIEQYGIDLNLFLKDQIIQDSRYQRITSKKYNIYKFSISDKIIVYYYKKGMYSYSACRRLFALGKYFNSITDQSIPDEINKEKIISIFNPKEVQ